jgi:hypothetical protein
MPSTSLVRCRWETVHRIPHFNYDDDGPVDLVLIEPRCPRQVG